MRIEKRYSDYEKDRDRGIERKREREREREKEKRGGGRGTERHKGKEIEKCHRNSDRDSHILTSFHLLLVLLISLCHVQCIYHMFL